MKFMETGSLYNVVSRKENILCKAQKEREGFKSEGLVALPERFDPELQLRISRGLFKGQWLS